MTAIANRLDGLEDRLKRSKQMVQFYGIWRELRELDPQISAESDAYDRARFLFLKGVLYTKAALAPIRERTWRMSSTDSLMVACSLLTDAVRILQTQRETVAMRPAFTGKQALLQQIMLLQQRCAYEWFVAYSALKRWDRTVVPNELMTNSGILGRQTLGHINQQLKRKKIVDSKMR